LDYSHSIEENSNRNLMDIQVEIARTKNMKEKTPQEKLDLLK
jgi:hypothetical protein